jgi:thioredoxin reductase (NADPH)
MKEDAIRDVIVVGGGPAGLTAATYAARDLLDVLLLEKGLCGGLPVTTEVLENYPGFPNGIDGVELMERFKAQAERFGAELVEFREVTGVEPADGHLSVRAGDQEHKARVVMIASGSLPRKLGIPGEEEYAGRGVSYCATCDGPLYKDQDVIVVGCGNSGLQEGEALLKHVKSVTFIECLECMRGEMILQERLKKSEKVRFLLSHQLSRIEGDGRVEAAVAQDLETGEEERIEAKAVFIYAGFLPNTGFLGESIVRDDAGWVVTNDAMETSVPGIYAIGDVRSKRIRQIDIACGEATVAAITASGYLREAFPGEV